MNRAVDEDSDITSCSKCRRLSTDPTVLPCLDLLCTECFQEVYGNSSGVAVCPRCGDQFQLPMDELSAVPARSFVGTLVALRKILNQNLDDDNCEICKQLATNSGPVAAAEYCCVECRQRLCAGCARQHPLCTATRNHTIAGFGLDSANTVLHDHKVQTPCCAIHKDCAAVHCYQCGIGLCSRCQNMCSGHELEVLTDHTHSHLTDKMKSLSDQLRQVYDNCKDKTERVQKLFVDRKTGMTLAEKKINDKADELISLIQKQRDDLLNSLHSQNDGTISSLESVSGRLSSALSANKRAARFAEELVEKGSVEDMLLNYRVLNERVTGVRNMSDISSVTVDSDCSVSAASLIDDVCTSLDSQSTCFPVLFCHYIDAVLLFSI